MESKKVKCGRIKNPNEMRRKKETLRYDPEKDSYTRTVEINGKKIFQTKNNISLRERKIYKETISCHKPHYGYPSTHRIIEVPHSSKVKIRKKDY